MESTYKLNYQGWITSPSLRNEYTHMLVGSDKYDHLRAKGSIVSKNKTQKGR